MEPTGRLYLCARCYAQVVICSACDRGQIYCGAQCSGAARRERQREAGRRYQQSRQGRHAHAGRSRRYRQRGEQIVTHQGSATPVADDLLAAMPLRVLAHETSEVEEKGCAPAAPVCCCCGRPCAGAVRLDFLATAVRRRPYGVLRR